MSILKLRNVTISYDRHPAIHHINGEFRSGSLTAITGPNGAGKSTLLKGIAGILKPEQGEIILENIQKTDVGYLPQASEIERNFPITVMQIVCSGYYTKCKVFGRISKQMRFKAQEALELVGLKDFAQRYIGQLSVGQFQRVLFARLLLQNAKLILLDEPFNAIDDETSKRLLDIISSWHKEQKTIICVLHDITQIKAHFPECVLLARECIAWGETMTTINASNQLKARFFKAAWEAKAEVCLK